jgi:iron(III) transport system substrate-binding protein
MPRDCFTYPLAVFFLALSAPISAQDKVLNLYSSRHYQTDEALYAGFTRQTGIRINRVEGGEDALIERIRNEGSRSPADVLITVDAGRLWRAEQMGLFQPVKSAVLESRIPANLRHPEGRWFGFSIRTRVIAYDKASIKPGDIKTYEDLADPKWRGKLCVRSGSHVYNLSLLSSTIGHFGEAKAESWARGIVANFARSPKGGDSDQIAAVAAGECQLALVNTYYYARFLRSEKPADKIVTQKVGLIFPNQAKGDRGAHVNISGGGVMKNAPNRDNAIRFLEYLASEEAQRYFADGNNEWPAVPGVRVQNAALASLGRFDYDVRNVAVLGRNQAEAQRIADRAGWK